MNRVHWRSRRTRGATALTVLLTLLVTLLLSGCGLQIPTDPDGTLDRVQGGEITIGVVHNPPRVDASGTSADNAQAPTGIEPELAAGFASSLDAEVTWVVGSEANIVKGLKAGTIDLAIAGFTDDTPWSAEAGMTRTCLEGTDEFGSEVKYVFLVPLGENAFLTTLETYICDPDNIS